MGLSSELALLQLVVDLTLKVSVLLGAVGALVWLWRGASAALRHWIWSGALFGVVLLPLLALFLPRLSLPLFPQFIPHAAPAVAWVDASVEPTLSPAQGLPDATPLQGTAAPSDALDSAQAPAALNPAAHANSFRLNVGVVALWLWAGGALLILARLALGMACVRWISCKAQPILDARWLNLLQEASTQLGILRPVELWRSPFPSTPMTWGVKKPVILLPDASEGWTAQKRRAVLTHELAHIRRKDTLTQMLGQLACALWWFNPLVWLASRQLRLEREKACDDQVLQSGARASEYARHLLDIASTLRSTRMASFATIAMARRSQLEGRLMAILNPRLDRRALTPLAVLSLVLLLGGVIVPLAAVQPWSAVPRQAAAILQAPLDELPLSASTPTGELAATNGLTPAKPSTPALDAGEESQQGTTALERAMDLFIETSAQLLHATSQQLNSLASRIADQETDLSVQLEAVSGQFDQTHQRLLDNLTLLLEHIEAQSSTVQEAQTALNRLALRAQSELSDKQAELKTAWIGLIHALEGHVALKLKPLGPAGQALSSLVAGLLDRLTVELSFQFHLLLPQALIVHEEGTHIRVIVDVDQLPDAPIITMDEGGLEIVLQRVEQEVEDLVDGLAETLDETLAGIEEVLDQISEHLDHLF